MDCLLGQGLIDSIGLALKGKKRKLECNVLGSLEGHFPSQEPELELRFYYLGQRKTAFPG